jgi:hypothetical protein
MPLTLQLRTCTLALVLCALALPLSAQARRRIQWSWSGPVSAGQTLTLDAVRGKVRLVAARGDIMTVVVVLHGVHDAPETVKMEAGTSTRGVAIRTRYNAGTRPPLARRGECLPAETLLGDFWDSDVAADVTVRVPAGVRVQVRLMWGDIDGGGVNGPVDLVTQNGSVRS